ncbi:MAG TPA: chitinase [Lachnospiraceae bacterium]|nr:chitinase [Lachnospiraceae bacterium]
MVVGYWHNFCNGSVNLKLSDVPDCYDMINVAFTGNSSTPGEATFAIDKDLSDALGGYSDEEFRKDIRAIQEQGRFVLISVGGAEGRISINSDAAAETFADSMIKIIEKYGFNGVDIDLEGGAVSGTAYIASALRKLHDHFGQDFIITMAPETAYVQNAQGSYLKLALQIKDILTICYPQFYNSGSMIGYDGEIVQPGTADFIDGQLTTIVESGLDASQVGIGLPSIPKAAGSGYISSDVIERAVRAFVTGGKADRFIVPKAYSGLRAMMCWSINWDATNGYAWGKAMSDLMDEVPSMKAAPADTTITGSATDWNSSSTYNTGDIVYYNGIYYRCKWWNQNNAPTTGQTSPWERAA